MTFNISEFPEAFETPDWLSANSAWIYHIPMIPVFLRLLHPSTFVELGTFRGDSYMGFCQAIAKIGLETTCTAIDTWQGDAHAGFYGPQVLAELRIQHDPRYGQFSRLLQTDFDSAPPTFADNSIDLLHIDGLHTYEAVKHDYDTWIPKLTDRGVVLFHDTAIRERGFGVWQLWKELAATAPSFNIPYGCGLGILAAGKNVPPPFLQFLERLNADHVTILPQFAALGRRNELMRNCMMLVARFHDAQEMVNQWRKLTGQAIRNATPAKKEAWDDPATFANQSVKDIGQVVADAVQLMTETTALRKAAKKEPAALPVPAMS